MTPGTKLGSYDVLAPIGKGGMGEVWKARDTKLGRDVALKILPAAFASDPDRMARFEREARVLASLDHPNIAAIYGLEESDGVRALVLALIDGPTLADRIAAGPIPLDEAIQIARQIAEAVEYAHERGVIHRDLKPANIKITSGGMVKVLDFGLAKALDDEPAAVSSTNSPTLTMNATRAGVLLGTAAYMSPEQAKGKQADRRSDIWSFGVVLYEMLTGKPPFSGESVGDILASVIKDEPKLDAAPAELRGLVARCLNKEPRKRLQAIGEARITLENPAPLAQIAAAPARLNRPWPWAVAAAVLAVVAIAASFIAWRVTRPVNHPLTRLSVDLGPDAMTGVNITVAISPDGRRLVFPARGADAKQQLATRLLDQAEPTLLPGTEGGFDPFFSPDGQWIGFFASGQLKKLSVQGGAPVALCPVGNPRGATWGEDGNIVAALGQLTPLSLVSAAGGAPKPLTRLAPGEVTHRWPQVLPGAQAVLFSASPANAGLENANIEAVSLKTGQIKVLEHGGYYGRYVSSGHLVYVHQGVLFGVGFDPARLEVRGAPVPLLEDLAANPATGGGQFDISGAASGAGTLVYLAGKNSAPTLQVAWLDSSGKTLPLISAPGAYEEPRFSPDGRKLALVNGSDISIYDLERDTATRLTFTGATTPIWAPDGGHIVFRTGGSLFWIRSDGAGEPQRLLENQKNVIPWSFSPDGRRLAYREQNPEAGLDLWTLSLDLTDPDHPKTGKPELFLRTPTGATNPRFSPDGRWIAYRSNESGNPEIYVRPFPAGNGGKWQISSGGGLFALWSNNGRDLFYETSDHRIMVVNYTVNGESFMPGKPRLWSDKQLFNPAVLSNLDLAPDGKRFAVLTEPDTAGGEKGSVHVTMLLNFSDELRRRIPVNK